MKKVFMAAIMAATSLTPVSAAELIIGIDLSDSSPLTLEDAVAKRAAKTVALAASKMKRGDIIKLRSFGEPGVSETQIHETVKLTGRKRASKVAKQVQTFIASLPQLVRDGKIRIENRTNALGWLELTGPVFECSSSGRDRMMILSDGIEWSGTIKGQQLLEGAPLPPPSHNLLSGCRVEMWGVGQQQRKFGNDARWYPILRKSWKTYMELAGVASFEAYGVYSE